MARKSNSKNGDLFIRESGPLELTDKSAEQRALDHRQVECLGLTFANDEERRQHFLDKLREKLEDPAFRQLAGFPSGTDEDILALSDPPYFTACANPWLAAFIQHYGTAYTPEKSYQREPFAADVKENKHHAIYTAHTYHTKVPHRAIMRYILHYTEPGDCILDAFAGTGMTAVAAQLCGDRDEVQELGYQVKDDGTIVDQDGAAFSRLGARRAIMNDLAPVAGFLAHWHNHAATRRDYSAAAAEQLNTLRQRLGWMYQTLHQPSAETVADALTCIRESATPTIASSSAKIGTINYVIWSEVFSCSHCGSEVVYWDVAVDKDNGLVRERFDCPNCQAALTKRGMELSFESHLDLALNTAHRRVRCVPVLINYSFAGRRYEKVPDQMDVALAQKIDNRPIENWYPAARLPEGIETRRNDAAGLTHFHHFYTARNLAVFAAAWSLLPSSHKWIVTGCLHRGSKQHQVAITRVGGEKAGAGGATAGHRRGTLYVPSNQVEMNALTLISDRAEAIAKAATSMRQTRQVFTSTQSASSLALPDNSIDYFFFDPPFGANIAYSELNSTTEAWLRVFTNARTEAIQDRGQKKSIHDYKELISSCFAQVYRALKPGRWMTVEFSNTQAAVWNAIQTALQEAGFIVANVSALNKGRGGLMAITGVTAVKQDLVISAYKPNGGLAERFAQQGNPAEGVWDFVQTHLKNLPLGQSADDQLTAIAERDPRIIYDRMVAFCIGHNTPVPLSSAEFQIGLAERFSERDGMYFLPEQAGHYDKKRAQVDAVGQLTIFVEDERSAISWLRSFLTDRPSVYQDIQPPFMQQLGAGWKKCEAPPDLRTLLDQNFLIYAGTDDVPSQIHSYLSSQFKDLRNLSKDDARLREKAANRWYVPDPNKAVDLEKLRDRALLREFAEYKTSTQKRLKVFRIEAIRVGFKRAYDDHDYQTIVSFAARLPENVLQEDEKILMYYDVARMRLGED